MSIEDNVLICPNVCRLPEFFCFTAVTCVFWAAKRESNLRKIIFGAIWFFVFWLGALFVGGAIVGSFAISGAVDSVSADELSRKAGEQFAYKFSGIILIVSLLTSIVGAWFGFLPGTKKKKND